MVAFLPPAAGGTISGTRPSFERQAAAGSRARPFLSFIRTNTSSQLDAAMPMVDGIGSITAIALLAQLPLHTMASMIFVLFTAARLSAAADLVNRARRPPIASRLFSGGQISVARRDY